MKRWIFLLQLLMTAASCGLTEIGDAGLGSSSGGGVWGSPVVDEDVPETLRSVYYMTVLEYPKGYDWHSDVGVGTVKCSLAVYMNGVPMMRVPVGEEYEVSSAPDMHRIIDGHLYTDYSDGEETVVKKDGVELFRYEGRERMCGMSVINGDVYTLGEDRGANGFTYRKNGEIVMSRPRGSVMGTLYLDGECPCFSFMDYIQTSDGSLERYYSARDGVVFQVAVREDVKKVWDIVTTKDEVSYVATLTGVDDPVLVRTESLSTISLPVGVDLLSCRLIHSEHALYVDCVYRFKNASVVDLLWHNGAVEAFFSGGQYISSAYVAEGGFFCTLNPSDAAEDGIIFRSGERFQMPAGYVCMGQDALSVVNGILHVGLSSSEDECPLVWKDGEVDTLKVNGFISGIYARSVESDSLPR